MSEEEAEALFRVLEIAAVGTYPNVHAADEVGQRDYGLKIVMEVVFREMAPSRALRILEGERNI